MGTITRSFANNLTTGGVLKADAFNNASLNNVTALNAAIATGNMVLISSQTASNSASISFTTGIDSTYKEYQFWFVNIYSHTDNNYFTFNMSTDSGSNYNVTKTTTKFWSTQYENGTGTALVYRVDFDLAQSTAFQALGEEMGGANTDPDANLCGSMSLFNPASTTYVKHFISRCQNLRGDELSSDNFVAGYGNTTSAVNAIQFKLNSGNFSGTILMYGIK
jgi:hypothetical protein